jgi:GH24 family phage-related lysozyme (muramidase)
MLTDKIIGKGTLTLQLFNEAGELVDERNEENLVVTVGLGHITSRLVGVAQGIMSHMAVGTNNTAAAAGNTTLNTELARVALDSLSRVTVNVTDDTLQAVATFGAGVGTGALVEAGILNASSAGVLLNRTVFSVINKGAADSLVITWKVTFA